MFFGNKQQLEELTAKNLDLQKQLDASKLALVDTKSEVTSLTDQLAIKELELNKDRTISLMLLESVTNVDQIRESVAELADRIIEKNNAMNNLNEVFNSSSEVLASISATVEDIGSRAIQSSEKMSSLRAVSDSIANFVSVITNISDQTNLLALNAAIEAARAGDQGRGFAVVADEVRALAQNTGNATSEIGSLIDTIDSDSETAAAQIEQLCQFTESISQQNNSLGDSYKHILDSSKQMKEVINQSALSAFIQTVKLDHIVWKSSVYSVLLGESHQDLDNFSDHQSCRLGEWYYRGEGKTYAGQSAFTSIEKPHKTVHEAGILAIKAAQAEEPDSMAAHLKQMESASNDIFRHLTALQKQA